jgi:hypothetical protein
MGISGVSGFGSSPGIGGVSSSERKRAIDPLLEATAGANSDAEDVLDLSEEGKALAAGGRTKLPLASLFDFETPEGRVTAPDVKSAQKLAQEMVQGRLQSRLAERGVDTSKEIRLQVAGDGRVIVANDHPQRAEIEKIFTDDEQLRNQFVRLSALTSMAASIDETVAFQQAYAKDPYAAVARYSYLFNQANKGQCSMVIQGERFEALCERPGETAGN